MSSRTVSGFISVLTGKFGITLISALTTPLLVRILGSESYGDYAFLLSIFSVITILAHAGISAGIRKYIAEDRSINGWKDYVFVFYARLAIGLAVFIGICLILIGSVVPVNQLFGPRYSIYFILLGAMLMADQMFYVSRYTLMGLHFERHSEPITVLKQILFGVFGLTLAYLGLDVVGVLTGTIIASLICAFAATWVLRTRIDLIAIFRPLPSNFPKRNLIEFNLYNTVFILLTTSLYNTDILLLQPLVGSQQTGFYKSALVVAEFLWIVPQAIQIVFIHSSSELWSQGDHEGISQMASQATRYTLLFTILLLIGIAALASEFMQLYFGAGFSDAVTPLLLLLPGALGFAIARPIYAIGQGKGNLEVLIMATGISAIINLALNLLLIPRYGMAGAAIATSIGYGSMVAFHGFTARHIGYDPFRDLRIFQVAITALFSTIIIFGVSYIISSGFLSLVIVPPLGFIGYVTLALRTGAITSTEIIPFLQQIPAPFSRWSIKFVSYVE